MSIKVWPFLVSRNRYLDYRTVVAPDFICELKIPNLLARVTEGELTEPGQGFIRQVVGSKADDFTIVFRVIKAMERDINATEKDNILKDQCGREIYVFEGIVAQGIQEDFTISESYFQNIHQQLIVSYQEFWDLVNPTLAKSSQSFIFDIENVASPAVLEKLEPFVLTPKPPKPVPKMNTIENIKKPSISSKWLLLLTFLLMLIIGLSFLEKVSWEKTIFLGCASIFQDKIEFKDGDNINIQLAESKKDYSDKIDRYINANKENISLFDSSKIASFKNVENLESFSKLQNQEKVKLSKYSISVLNCHPINLTIFNTKIQKIIKNSEIILVFFQ